MHRHAGGRRDQFGCAPVTPRRVCAGSVDLTRDQYEALHDGFEVEGLSYTPSAEFRIARVGKSYETSFQDLGVEYYEYVT